MLANSPPVFNLQWKLFPHKQPCKERKLYPCRYVILYISSSSGCNGCMIVFPSSEWKGKIRVPVSLCGTAGLPTWDNHYWRQPLVVLQVSNNIIHINEFRCYEAKIEESEKSRQLPGVEPRTLLAWAASALPLSHNSQTTYQPSQSSICTAERIFQSTPNKVLMAHTEWLPGVQLRHSVPSVQYI